MNRFVSRESTFGLIPLSQDCETAQKLLNKFFTIVDDKQTNRQSLEKELWKLIKGHIGSGSVWESRALNALPENCEDAKLAAAAVPQQHDAPVQMQPPFCTIDVTGFQGGLGMTIHVWTEQLKQFSCVSSAVLQIGDDTIEVMGDSHANLHILFPQGLHCFFLLFCV